MKMKDVWHIIKYGGIPQTYRVHFEWHEGRILRSDYFPESGEDPIENEEEAWNLARKFANRMKGKVVNVYVVGKDWASIEIDVDWHDRIIFNRYPERKVDMSHMEKVKI